jgi:hypothetical protein
LSQADWLCQPPWTRTKAALGVAIVDPSSFDLRYLRLGPVIN